MNFSADLCVCGDAEVRSPKLSLISRASGSKSECGWEIGLRLEVEVDICFQMRCTKVYEASRVQMRRELPNGIPYIGAWKPKEAPHFVRVDK